MCLAMQNYVTTTLPNTCQVCNFKKNKNFAVIFFEVLKMLNHMFNKQNLAGR